MPRAEIARGHPGNDRFELGIVLRRFTVEIRVAFRQHVFEKRLPAAFLPCMKRS
jgi:hypothetical protein